MTVCISLYDESGNMLRPWAEAGYECHCYDLANDERSEGNLHFHRANLLEIAVQAIICAMKPYFVFGFPPCTDVAVSGAAHFESKMRRDPFLMTEAADLAAVVPRIGVESDAIWAFENPKSMLKYHFGEPDFKFHPWEYGGYLPEDDVHPRWPEYIPPRDAYPKLTWLWASRWFRMPEKAPVYCPPGYSPQHLKLGGTSAKTKQIRSETPRGFAKAVFMANRKD